MSRESKVALKHADKVSASDPPVLAVFPSGMPSEIADKVDFPFQYLAHKDPRKAKQAMIYAESSQSRFVGSNFEEDSISKSRHNYAVAVFRPGKNSAKVIAANGLFVVKQTKFGDISGIDTDTVTDVDFNTMRTELTERFGSRKRRRELRSIENNKFDIDSDASSLLAVETAMDTAAVLLPQNVATDDVIASQTAILPAYNADAKEAENIYPFTSFLPKNLWDNLDTKSLIKPTESKEELEFNYPSFVILRRSRFNNLSGEDAKMLARQLLMLTYLLRLLRVKKPRNVAEMIKCPPAIGEYLKRTYVPHGETKETKAKILCHAIILAINSSTGATLDSEALRCIAGDCQTTVSQLMPYFLQVGAKATKEKAKLTAPFKLPSLQPAGAGSRKR